MASKKIENDHLKVESAMVMAAGLGTRLRPYTEKTPKAFLPVCGTPVIQYALALLSEISIEEVVINVHYLPDVSRQAIDQLKFPNRVIESDETQELLGSAGGIRQGHGLMKNSQAPFLIVNADVVFDVDWRFLIERHVEQGSAMTMAIHSTGIAGQPYGEILTEGDRIIGTGPPKELVPFYLGAAVLNPSALASVPSTGAADFAQTILSPLIARREVSFVSFDGFWADIGTPDYWRETEERLRNLETLPQAWRALLGA